MQETFAYVLVAAAAFFLAYRWWRRRATGNCCGEPECPAAKETVKKLERAGKR